MATVGDGIDHLIHHGLSQHPDKTAAAIAGLDYNLLPIPQLHTCLNVDQNRIDEDAIAAIYTGSADPYRYWDATASVEFGLRMGHYSLEHSLVDERDFIARFDQARKKIEQQFDVRNSDVVALIRLIQSQGGTLSNNRREQFVGRVESKALDTIEQAVREEFFAHTDDKTADVEDDHDSSDLSPRPKG